MTQQEFNSRVQYNADLFNRQAEKNEFTPSMYYLFDREPKELSSIAYGKLYHDIFAAAVCGTLVLSDLAEKDSIEMKRGKIIKVELKTSYVNTKHRILVFDFVAVKMSVLDVYVSTYIQPLFALISKNFSP